MKDARGTPWAERAAGTELVRYALLPEDTPARPAGDVTEEARGTKLCELLEAAGGRRIGEVRRSNGVDQKRLELWATKKGDAFVTFDGVFFEATTLLADGRAIVTTKTLKKDDDPEKAFAQHTKAVESASGAGTVKPMKHEDGETWLAICEGLAPERARRDAIALWFMFTGVVIGIPLALYFGIGGDHSVTTIVDLVFAGIMGGLLAAMAALFPVTLYWGALRVAAPAAVPDRDEGPYRAAGKRPHVRIAEPIDATARVEEEDEAEATPEEPGAEAKRRVDPP